MRPDGSSYEYPSVEIWKNMLNHDGAVPRTLHQLAQQWLNEEPENAHLRTLVQIAEQTLAERERGAGASN